MAQLTEEALSFALKNSIAFGDSDFFPKPFEYRAIEANWNEVRNHLLSIGLSTSAVQRPKIAAAAKPNGTFRVVHQLDPLNHLVYTAAVYLLAPRIESARPPVHAAVACAYRIEIDDKRGSFFADTNGYEMFLKRCSVLAGEFTHVLVADISDYYNQINLHRLRNAIAHCDNSLADLGEDLEDFLMELNDRVSKGIPVGPPASIVLAEANMIDVDDFIRDKSFTHSRYVDDIRIFGRSEVELRVLLQDLTSYLYDNHRLILSSAKTKVLPTLEFEMTYLESPDIVETRAMYQQVDEILATFDPYEVEGPPEEVTPEELEDKQSRIAALVALIGELCERNELDLGLARYILRKSRKLKIRAILPKLLERMDFFAPVVSDAVFYLDKVLTPAVADQNRERFLEVIRTSDALSYEHFRMWIEYFFALKYPHFEGPEVQEFIFKTASTENKALAALRKRALQWVRSQKQHMDSYGRWERRAVIRASAVMPKDERDVWLERLDRSSTDYLEKTLIKWVRSFAPGTGPN